MYDADSIGEQGLCLSVLITCGVNFQFGSLCPFGVIVGLDRVGGVSALAVGLWIALAVVMIGLYVYFN